MSVGLGCGRPLIDHWRPSPSKEFDFGDGMGKWGVFVCI